MSRDSAPAEVGIRQYDAFYEAIGGKVWEAWQLHTSQIIAENTEAVATSNTPDLRDGGDDEGVGLGPGEGRRLRVVHADGDSGLIHPKRP